MTLAIRVEQIDAQIHVSVEDQGDTVLVIAESEDAANAILVAALALREAYVTHGHSKTDKARKALYKAKEKTSSAMQPFTGPAAVKIDIGYGYEISIFHSGIGNDQ